ncbi:MAG: metal-dependent hydrolase, partial [Deltaproteobacteria bacterium]|nr:metal-dependent hydrolase [Nannocystaceae bacterium]
MTPAGHLAIGVLIGHASARARAWAPRAVAVGAVLPDIDFLMVWSSHFNAWHRVVTHNLLFVLASSLLLAIPLARRQHVALLAMTTALFVGGLSHLLVDACIDANASNGVGVALGWPFDARMVAPIELVTPSDDGRGWADPLAAAAGAARGLAWELPFMA